MESGKWKVENEERALERGKFSASSFLLSNQNTCSACGARAARENAKFCRICGKSLSEGYEPLDNLRASYRLQRKSFSPENSQKRETVNLFETNKNSASESAKALVVYSLVPYLGILFCPFALISGSVGIFVSRRQPTLGGARASFYSIASTVIIFIVQIFLWWLLYFIPELGKNI